MKKVFSYLFIHHGRMFSVLGLGIGLLGAIRYIWICDDAYISYIYSRNLWEGNGLVFQLGEKVEGYTNFLWTLLLTLSYPLDMRIEDFSVYMGILCYFFLLLSLRNPYLLFSYSLFYFGWEYATSGLETSFYTLIITLSYQCWKTKNYPALFLLSSTLPMIRPDGAIFSIFYFVFFLFRSSSGERKIGYWITGKNGIYTFASVLLVLIFLGKIIYYGEIFPNTFYAKVGEGDYFRQGLQYLLYFHREYIVWSIFLIVGIVFSRSSFSWILLVYIFYIIYVGGDFMFARFIVPILPVSMLITWDRLLETSSSWQEKFSSNGKKISLMVLFIFLIAPLFSTGAFTKNAMEIYKETGISHERLIYKDLGKSNLSYDKEALRDLNVSFWGAQAHFIYYMRPNLAIESSTGLTDFYLARRKLSERGRIGHEKTAPLDYLKERGIHIVMADVYSELREPGRNLIYRWNGMELIWKVLYLDEYRLLALSKNPNFDTSQLLPNLWKDDK